MLKPNQLLLLLLFLSTSLAAQTLEQNSQPIAAVEGVLKEPSREVVSATPTMELAPAAAIAPTPTTAPLLDTLYRFSAGFGAGVLFWGFDQRSHFSNQLSALVAEAKKSATTAADSSAIRAIPFQKVDLAFPVQLSLQYHPSHWLSLAAGTEWMRQSQEGLLLQAEGVDELIYTLSVWNAFLEISFLIPPELLSIQGGDGLRVALRRYWLPAAWIETLWNGEKRELWSQFSPSGAGWGLSIGSHFAQFGPFQAGFQIEWSSIQAVSEQSWKKILPDNEETKKAQWSLGGIGAQLSIHWNFSENIITKGDDDGSSISNPSSH